MSNIAATIQNQIGNRALYMLGAKNLIDHGDALSFRIRGSRKANYIKVTLDPSDTYSIEFKKLGRAPAYKVTDVADFSGVYVDSLHAIIERTTGLYTSI